MDNKSFIRLVIVIVVIGAFMHSILLGVIVTLVVALLAYLVFKLDPLLERFCPVCADVTKWSRSAQLYTCTGCGLSQHELNA